MSINIFHAYILDLSLFHLINIIFLNLTILWRYYLWVLIIRIILRCSLNLIIKNLFNFDNSLTHLQNFKILRNQSFQFQITHLTWLLPNQSISRIILLPATKHIFLNLLWVLHPLNLFSLFILRWDLGGWFIEGTWRSSCSFILDSPYFLSKLVSAFT